MTSYRRPLRDWVVVAILVLAIGALVVVGAEFDWAKVLMSGALGGLFVVALQELSAWMTRPSIKLSFASSSDFVTPTPLVDESTGEVIGRAIYLRLRVENTGHRQAKACRAFLVGAHPLEGAEASAPRYMDSLPLQWSCRQRIPGGEAIDIPRGIYQYVDVLASGISSRTGGNSAEYWHVQFAVDQPVRYVPLFSGRGKRFLMRVLVSGDGVDPDEIGLDVHIGASWDQIQATRS